MTSLRDLSKQEKAVIAGLLQGKAETLPYLPLLDDLLVAALNDGGMGSLLLVPKDSEGLERSMGKQIALGEFVDSDGVLVSAALNVDREGRLYELDVWKVDYTPLSCWPNPTAIRIVG
jgi:hypothetical protein